MQEMGVSSRLLTPSGVYLQDATLEVRDEAAKEVDVCNHGQWQTLVLMLGPLYMIFCSVPSGKCLGEDHPRSSAVIDNWHSCSRLHNSGS